MPIAINLPFRRTRIFALSLAFLLLAASCSSSESSSSALPTSATSAAEPATTTAEPETPSPPSTASATTSTAPSPTSPAAESQPNISTSIAASFSHSCAVSDEGKVFCWGSNEDGKLGIGKSEIELDYSAIPLEVVGIADAAAVATGENHTCALHQSGAVSCWGSDEDNQIGIPDSSGSVVPVQIEGIEDAVWIATGEGHTCAVHQDGTISCWGYNRVGALGNRQAYEDENFSTPTPVRVEGITDATAVTASSAYTCALHRAGTISCWGNNSYGQLGSGQTSEELEESAVPVQVADITDATAIASSQWHSCALRKDGTIACWGDNDSGLLGSGHTREELEGSAVPVQVADITDAIAIATGKWHSCALRKDGTIACWGRDGLGRFGEVESDFQETDQLGTFPVPVQVTDITDAVAIATGEEHSCALHQNGKISCWGYNLWGQLGNGQSVLRVSILPVEVVGITDATAVSLGRHHSCALHQDGTVSCWGTLITSGMSLAAPVKISGIAGATNIATGEFHTCTVHQDGTISCWGINDQEILGGGQADEDLEHSAGPVQVKGITDATAIATGWGHTCALHQIGTVSCWGRNYHGELGNGASGGEDLLDGSANSATPVNVTGITDAVAIAAGFSHSCALHQTGSVSCWGEIGRGRVLTDKEQPDSELEYSSVPVKVVGVTDAIAIAAGRHYSCAIRKDGTVFCWQYISEGAQLGSIEAFRDSNIPVREGEITDAIDIASDGDSSCVLHRDGTVSCWGIEAFFFVSIADNEPLPVHMPDIDDAIAVDVSSDERLGNLGHACALSQGGKISCWGYNDYGQLGSEVTWSTVPTEVIGFGGQYISQASTVAVRGS